MCRQWSRPTHRTPAGGASPVNSLSPLRPSSSSAAAIQPGGGGELLRLEPLELEPPAAGRAAEEHYRAEDVAKSKPNEHVALEALLGRMLAPLAAKLEQQVLDQQKLRTELECLAASPSALAAVANGVESTVVSDEESEEEAAVWQQAVMRGWRRGRDARREKQRKRCARPNEDEERRLAREAAVLRLQSVQQGRRAREVASVRRADVRMAAAVAEEEEERRLAKEEEERRLAKEAAALRLQSVQRRRAREGSVARRADERMAAEEEMAVAAAAAAAEEEEGRQVKEAAVLRLQSVQRGRRAREVASVRRADVRMAAEEEMAVAAAAAAAEEEERRLVKEAAVLRLQSVQRGRRAREVASVRRADVRMAAEEEMAVAAAAAAAAEEEERRGGRRVA
eukprot:SAG11_NODE_3148_length_2647_cov_4.043564_1_plen_396_part_00